MNKIAESIHGYVGTEIIEQNGEFPNNEKLPLLVYKGAMHLHPDESPDAIVELFRSNNWTNSWKDSVLHKHHFHTTTHEVLGIFCGKADIQFGGEGGLVIELVRGDAVVIPAGVAHKNLESSRDFVCIGAYPDGRDYDMNCGDSEDLKQLADSVKNVPIPATDPILGKDGPLVQHWIKV